MKNKNIIKNSLIILFALVLLAAFLYSKLAENATITKTPSSDARTDISTAPVSNDIAAPSTPSSDVLTPKLNSGTTLPEPKRN
ncbi:MAG: hypothetical protein RI996_11 [Candidatus Parcubacteria bacterium]|jgi:hypothetical protein